MLSASKRHPAIKRGNGSMIKWMVSALATLIIAKAVWDLAMPTGTTTTISSSGAPPSNKTKASPSSSRSKKSAGHYLYDDEPNVIEVTSEVGFFQTSQKPRIVEFYSPYCGHCRHFKASYVKVANEVHAKYGSAVEFYGVSCLAQHGLCAKYGANSYPTVLAMPAGSNQGTKMGQMFFGLAKVEDELKLSGGAVVVSQ